MTNLGDLVERARVQLLPVLDRPGGILYSASHTLTPGRIYLMGLNPGGDPSLKDAPSIGMSLNGLAAKRDNAYVDGEWDNSLRSYEAGQAPLQKRVAFLTDALGCPITSVCATNLIFMQSRSARDLDFVNAAQLCWPVHELMLDMVRPRVILAFGNSAISPYGYLRGRFAIQSDESITSGHGSWRCRSFRVKVGSIDTRVIGLPHLSRYSPTGKQEVLDWLVRQVDE